MAWTKVTPPGGKVRDVYGSVIGNVRTLVDYTKDDTSVDRTACLLQVYDYTNGSTDTITIDPSDASSTTWTEGTDFNATTDNATTAENIASAINATTDYSAEAMTGHAWDPYVSVEYTASGHINSASSGDTTAWEMQEVNATNGTIAKVGSDDTGTRKNQPLFTDSDGFWKFYLDNRSNFDLLFNKPGATFDNTRYENISPTGLGDLLYDKDADTKVEVEQSTDEDIIRFYIDGTEALNID